MRLIVGISGASGVIMGWYLLRALHEMPGVETHLIITEGAAVTFPYETDLSLAEVCALADVVHDNHDMAASISSGSYETDGMIIIPCSMKTVADVCLKEGRKVVIVPREMPMSHIHLRNIKEAADYGCCVVPPVLTFYNGADTVEKQIQHIIGKVLMQFHLHSRDFVPWQGSDAAGR